MKKLIEFLKYKYNWRKHKKEIARLLKIAQDPSLPPWDRFVALHHAGAAAASRPAGIEKFDQGGALLEARDPDILIPEDLGKIKDGGRTCTITIKEGKGIKFNDRI